MKTILLLIPMLVCILPAQSPDVCITAKGTYTTSTRFLYNVDTPDNYSEGNVLESNFGFGVDARWNILWDRFYLGASIERIRSTGVSYIEYPDFQYLRITREEGFEVTAVELSGYYIVPISSDQIRFYLGGGFGLYDGERIFALAGVQSATTMTTSTVGIHVLTGIDYWLTSRLALRGELKFRDPHFDVINKFDQTAVDVAGYQIPLPQNELSTRVNLFGVNYIIGIVVQL